jgi:hypothetical protein
MRVCVRTGPLLLVLAVALAGCSQSGDTPGGKDSTAVDKSAEYVLTIPGMS